jgi:serine/threonine-protein kinase
VQTAATGRADALIGRCLESRYRILEPIARGGMSTVYAAVDERLDRLVAVKVMSAALSADPAFSDRFAREARAAARLTHLNAVSVYDQGHEIGTDGHHVFLVMELVEGRTLRELLRERGRVSAAEAVSLMEPVLSALSAAHRAGLVHRDVKPENILLSDDGVVKVADFGLARAVEADAASTRTGLMMGTVAYCAPEQISRGSADPRSDVYSAGIVLFELLTGQPPYRGDSAMNVAYQHVHSRVPAPSSRVRGAIPDELDELVIAATDSDPTGRPSDAGAFLAEIADLRAELSLPVMPVPPRAREHRSERPFPRFRTPDAVTTEAIRNNAGQYATAVDPNRGRTTAVPVPPAPPGRRQRDDNAPPPPVVIPPPRPPAGPRRRRWRSLVVLLVLLLVGLAAGWAGWYFAAGRYSHVPAVKGSRQDSAVSRLRDAGYQVVVQQGGVYDDHVPNARVLRTEPTAHTRAIRGTRVTVVMSWGPHLYEVQQVRNETFDQATADLLAVGPVTVADKPVQVYDETVPSGNVVATRPAAGVKVRASQAITLVLSLGKPLVTVPTIAAGSTVADATAALQHAKLRPAFDKQYNDTIADGDVIGCDQSGGGGSSGGGGGGGKVREGSTVQCHVSKGPETVIVPDIPTGASVDDARAAITAAHLVPRVLLFPGTEGDANRVVLVDPNSGTPRHSGQVVTIYAIP